MKFIIIIPVYNCENYISNTIESVLKQTYDQYQIHIIDDKSSDNSLNIINEYNADFIFEPSVNELISKLQIILDNPELIDDFADKICLNKFNHTLSDHSKEIKHLYNTLLGT